MIKILVTLGPASQSEEVIEKLASYNVLFRLNGSHSDLEWHRQTVEKIRRIARDAFILLDVPGVKPRTANTDFIDIKKGQQVIFGESDFSTQVLEIPLTKTLPSISSSKNFFSVNDGQYLFKTVKSGKNFLIGESQSEFRLFPKKGVNVPNSIYDEQRQLEIYTDFIQEVHGLDIDGLGLSFVQTNELIKNVRKMVPNLVLVSKIENSEGLRNCREIIGSSDAVMIDRGDLAAEIGLPELFNSVVNISNETKSAGKPLIMATENLETMMQREIPSKSEVMSISHSISIGADCIMLSEETAVSQNGLSIVSWLDKYLEGTVPNSQATAVNLKDRKYPEIWKLTKHLEDFSFVLMSRSGYAIFDFMAVQSSSEVTVVTNSDKVIAITKLFSKKLNTIKFSVDEHTPIEIIWKIVEENKSSLFENHDKVAAIFVSKYVKKARANCITLFLKSDFSN